MKLVINRREQKSTLFGFGKLAGFWLDFTLEATAEEAELVKMHRWGDVPLFNGPRGRVVTIGGAIQRPHELFFDDVGSLQESEDELIEGVRTLKSKLETVSNFADGGPREIDL